jgi:hypothetical protein
MLNYIQIYRTFLEKPNLMRCIKSINLRYKIITIDLLSLW